MGTLASELRPIARALSGAPRVYVDANLPAGVVATMRRQLGWDVLFVVEDEDLRRAADVDHFCRARDLGRTLITLDRDFLDDRRFPPSASPGVVVCTAADERTLRRLIRYLDRHVLRAATGGDAPLGGRKIAVTSEVLTPAGR